ncbi:hypothetical protein [Aestuariivita sp.]|jgi:hypothetical protein|uniref:hypothetical protein n=1 Tax=Aestuariivita sp. TaxID=1872407 RepID=UPI00217237AF|nr:hypothetical protein [Aestuariivita sp.]MCE8009746.1 hypothetical protein [Aestuariivita sp.]
MTRKIILHIGPAKTGTSSLQEALFANRALLMQNGFHYPEFGRHRQMPNLPGHHGIQGELGNNRPVPQDIIDGMATLDPDLTVVFSSENLANLPQEAIRQLIETLSPAAFQVVYYARRWDHLVPSVWQELIKHGHSQSYLEYINRQLSAPRNNHHLNYKLPLDRWANVVGKSQIDVFSYDGVNAADLGIVAHFFDQVLGIAAPYQQEPRSNTRNTPIFTETLRMLNRLTYGGKPSSPKVRTELMRNLPLVEGELAEIEQMLKPYVARAPLCAPFVFFQIEREFLAQYAPRVRNLDEDGRLFGNILFQPTDYVQCPYLFETQALALYRRILERLELKKAPASSDVQRVAQVSPQQHQAD